MFPLGVLLKVANGYGTFVDWITCFTIVDWVTPSRMASCLRTSLCART